MFEKVATSFDFANLTYLKAWSYDNAGDISEDSFDCCWMLSVAFFASLGQARLVGGLEGVALTSWRTWLDILQAGGVMELLLRLNYQG